MVLGLFYYNLIIIIIQNMVTWSHHIFTLLVFDRKCGVLYKERSSQECMHSRENLTSFLGSLKGGGEKHEGSAG